MFHMGYTGHRHRKGSADITGRGLQERAKESRKVVPLSNAAALLDDGSVVLKDRKRESYAKKVAGGMDKEEAWQLAFRDEVGKERAGNTRVKQYVARGDKEEELNKRIEWLRRNDIEAKISHRDKVSDYEQMMEKAKSEFMAGEKASPQYAKVYLDLEKRHDELVSGGTFTAKQTISIKISGMDTLLNSTFAQEMRRQLGIKPREEKKAIGEVVDDGQ